MDYEQYKQIDSIVENLVKKHLMNGSVESKEILAVTQAYIIMQIKSKELYFALAAILEDLEGNINPDDMPLYSLIEDANNVIKKADFINGKL